MQPLLYSTTTNTLHLRNFLQTPSLRQRLDTANLLDANHAERRLPVRRTTRREDLPRPRPAYAVLSKKLDNKSTSSDGSRALQQCARQEGERLVTRDAPPLLASFHRSRSPNRSFLVSYCTELDVCQYLFPVNCIMRVKCYCAPPVACCISTFFFAIEVSSLLLFQKNKKKKALLCTGSLLRCPRRCG